MSKVKAGKEPESALSTSGLEDESDFEARMNYCAERVGSVTALARKAGISQSGIRRYFNGGDPSRRQLVALARAAGVSVEWLATGEGARASELGYDAQVALVQAFERYRQTVAVGEPKTTAIIEFVDAYNNKSATADRVPGVEELSVEYLQRLLLEGPTQPDQPQSPEMSEFALIPRYDVQVSAGDGAHVDQEQELHRLAFRRDWLRHENLSPQHLVLVTAKGDSMEPTISEGDLILVDTSRPEIQDDSIYVLRRDGEVFAKRLQQDWEGGVWVRSDSPQYQDIHVGREGYQGLNIVGRVVWIARRV